MNYYSVTTNDLANGEGIRTTVFISGCTHMCEDCFNEELWDFNNGAPMNTDTMDAIIALVNGKLISGLSILGGDLYCQPPKEVEEFLSYMKKNMNPKKTIWVWTGEIWEDLRESDYRNSLKYIDVLIDGKYCKDKRDLSLKWRGSRNQRIIDVKKSLASNTIIMRG